MQILCLLQDFTGEQENVNKTTKAKLADLTTSIDKKFQLFKAYTVHDDLISKLEAFSERIEKMEMEIKEKQNENQFESILEREEMNNKINQQSGLIMSIEEKLKNLQYGANAQRRVEFVQNMNKVE